MKTKIKILTVMFLSSIAFITSCSENEFSLYGDSIDSKGDFSSFKWYTSGDRTTYIESEKEINLNDYVGFYDVSYNAISHTWEIPASAKFLNKEFTETDSIYNKFVIGGTVTTDDLANVYFPKAGVQEIVLTNTFKDSVTEAIKDGNQWKVTKVFTVDVFADPNPEGKVYRQNFIADPNNPTGPTIVDENNPYVEVLTITEGDNPKESEKGSWLQIEIEAGEKLQFEDLSVVGRVDAVNWFAEGGKPETSKKEIAEITYNKLGDYTAYFESSRTKEAGPVKSVSKLIPLRVKVIPSTKPFELGGAIKMDVDEVISFSVTGEAESIVNQEGNFTVHVTNTAAGFDQNIPVQSAVINSEDATIIELTLTESVYNTDEIEVSFTGGAISSVDERSLLDFGPVSVKLDLGENILYDGWSSFEDAGGNWKSSGVVGYWVGNKNGSEQAPIFARSTDQFFEGEASMGCTYPDGLSKVTLQGKGFAPGVVVTAGTYRISIMVYLEPGNTMKAFRHNLQDPFTSMLWDIENIERGKWVELSRVETIASNVAVGKKFDILIDPNDNPGVTSGEQKLYFDDLKWIVLNPR